MLLNYKCMAAEDGHGREDSGGWSFRSRSFPYNTGDILHLDTLALLSADLSAH